MEESVIATQNGIYRNFVQFMRVLLPENIFRQYFEQNFEQRDVKEPPEYPEELIFRDMMVAAQQNEVRRAFLASQPEKKLYNHTLCRIPKMQMFLGKWNEARSDEKLVYGENENITEQLSPGKRLNEIIKIEKNESEKLKSQYGLKRRKKKKKTQF